MSQSILSQLSSRMESATDAYADACDEEAEKENAYLAAFSTAWAVATEEGVAISARSKHVDADPVVTAAKQEYNRAIAGRKRTHAKVEELKSRIMAAQSHMRFVREQT